MRAPCGWVLFFLLSACDSGTDRPDARVDVGPPDPCAVDEDRDGDGEPSIECGGRDCDDGDPARFGGNDEACDAELDEDCNPTTLGPDGDRDGAFPVACCNRQTDGDLLCGTDCDDARANIGPTVPEVCDGQDNDCSGALDFPGEDDDLDGWADCADLPAALRDCDDGEAEVNPARTELCNLRDDDCDGAIDDGFDCGGTTPICADDGSACAPCDPSRECPDGRSICATAGPLAGACGECDPGDTDYCSSTHPYCETETLRCRHCLVDAHCPDSGFLCIDYACVCSVADQCTCSEDFGLECAVGQTCGGDFIDPRCE